MAVSFALHCADPPVLLLNPSDRVVMTSTPLPFAPA
jgi:hypothetical protein